MKIQNILNFARKNAYWAITFVLLLTAVSGQAQGSSDNSTAMMFVVSMVAVVAVIVLLVAIYALQVIKKLEQIQPPASGQEQSLWQRFLEVVNDRAPVEKEADIMLDHNYDGIRELDNHLPPWWKWLFYVTIIFGVVYLVGHHMFNWFPLQEQEYAMEMEEAKASMANSGEADVEEIDPASLTYEANAEFIAAGKTVFERNCVTCHGTNGQGGAGPNLTDDYWLHGGGIQNVFHTVTNGVPNTAMISWKAMLSPTDIRNVANYVLSIHGTNPANAKGPEGKLWKEGETNDEEPVKEATTEEPATTEEAVADTEGNTDGKNIFETTCAACHQPDGGGVMGLGPNLTDKYWKSGDGTKKAVHKIVTEGVPGTAMVAWSASLSDEQINAVVDYVMSLQGTTPANPKEPEGKLYE